MIGTAVAGVAFIGASVGTTVHAAMAPSRDVVALTNGVGTAQLEAGDRRAIYVRNPHAHPSCQVTGPGNETIATVPGDFTSSSGSSTVDEVISFNARKDGTCSLDCSSTVPLDLRVTQEVGIAFPLGIVGIVASFFLALGGPLLVGAPGRRGHRSATNSADVVDD